MTLLATEIMTDMTNGSYIITPIKLGIVNCYLVKIEDGFILIDTGFRRKRKELEEALIETECLPGKLKLIILTHQDFDHTGNARYIREKFQSRIGMHKVDTEAVERGDMLWNRKGRNIFTRILLKAILVAYRTGKFEKFSPDIYLKDGDDLSMYGINAKVIHIPGHSKGSIGILTKEGVLFCGDLFMNIKQPDKSSLVDEKRELNSSIEKASGLDIVTIYPGHGLPFTLEQFKTKKHQEALVK